MPSLKDIKNRISSVKNTQKITNAMKLVSASKFAKANAAVSSARPYSTSLSNVVARVFQSEEGKFDSPLVRSRESGKLLLLVLSTDRGLCGGLNTNSFKFTEKWIRARVAEGEEVLLILGGRKASQNRKKFALAGGKIISEREKLTDAPSYAKAKEIAEELVSSFLEASDNSEIKQVHIAYPKFESALAQTPKVDQFLPLVLDKTENSVGSNDSYVIEPAADQILDTLIKKQLNSFVFQALLECAASEHGARMSAMDSATRNAKEVTKKLTIQYNRARQAAITTELTEIISGAESL